MSSKEMESFSYDDDIVKKFAIATIIWGAVGMLVGVIIASQLADWRFNFGIEWLTFGRLRPLHTNAIIFAFVGNSIFTGIYHSTQRLLKTRLFSDTLSKIHFWGWQLIIVLAAVTLPLGISGSKEYAELEWPIDILITVIWVVFAVNFFGTLAKRREKHIYVSIWFYIASIVTIALLHIVNSLEIPVSLMKSYPIFAGVQDAMVQWWYGHNAVAFFLTTPVLGLMYYYVPKAINRPVYSYRLSIVHFWSLIFLYIWAGPHHLLYTALPEWAQTVGMVFSLMLWAPSWGGMINGLLTLRGAWDRVRKEAILKYFVTAITFYGMSTFEGPLLSIKSVNSLGHYTDWIVGHVHGGGIGWNYMFAAGMLYYLVPRLWKTTVYSEKLSSTQFWTGTLGLVLYYLSMTVAGITQGLMWRAIDGNGQLVYPNFMETVDKILPMYWIRLIGGLLVFTSMLIMLYNLFKTIHLAKKVEKEDVFQAPSLDWTKENTDKGHRKLEGLTSVFTVLAVLAVLVGTVIEFIPALLSRDFIEVSEKIKPYTPLELAGRDLYVREGCYNCHSQMIRPMASEVLRYGKASEATEFIYDHPFQWGSKRTGPDLARIGGKYPDSWHYFHMIDPRKVSPGSIMPVYTWLEKDDTEYNILPKKLRVMQALGVPYTDEEVRNSISHAKAQAEAITRGMADAGVSMKVKDKQLIAMIAYLQRMGTDLTR
ncbi:MAG: cytochrome-c oxidase, cbb3-type subunit I [Halobacteriovoraceae bacterium]|jgi:cytochrome c oxidase cbb3-type subunit I/II|nr:cytochrome-c oxidase, cbb3-type subunit I [Halobacteriovoraceae bacterium]